MSIVVTGKSIEKAIADGLKQLDAKLEDVEIKVLSEGGLLKKAKVEMELTSVIEAQAEANKKAEELIKLAEANKKSATKEKVESKGEPKQETETIKPEKKQVDGNETVKLAKEWLEGLIYAYNINAEAQVEIKENGDVCANIAGENLGVLIGYHGEAMEAIGHLLNTYLYNKNKGCGRVFLDVSGYRAKRVEELKETAVKLAGKVVENKRKYKLDPMNSYERRVIHEALSTIPNIATHSEGAAPNRYLIIEYVADAE